MNSLRIQQVAGESQGYCCHYVTVVDSLQQDYKEQLSTTRYTRHMILSERNTTADNFSIAVAALSTFSVPQPSYSYVGKSTVEKRSTSQRMVTIRSVLDCGLH